MNAPTTPALDAEHASIDLQLLIPSPTNPRKRKGFDDKSLSELADSIRSIGIAQPILVRVALQDDGAGCVENKGNYEIVAGERRWRAAKIAGLAEVPCIIRNLDDLDVLKIQLVENKQREDLDELEEAEGYEKLLQQTDSDGNKFTVETIAKSMGVSKGTIYARMKLLNLCQDARQAFYDGKLDASRGLLIARIPVEKLQLQALKEALVMTHRDEHYLSYRGLRDLIQEKFMLDLAKAPFDINDATLDLKAGSCVACEHRTGNQPELFEDVDGKDVCTNPVCHAMKKTAHVLRLQKQAKAEGNTLMPAKESKKILAYAYDEDATERRLREAGYATLDQAVPGDPKKRTFREMIEEAQRQASNTDQPVVPKVLVEDPHKPGQLIETVSMEAAYKQLREVAGFNLAMPPAKKEKDTKAEEEKIRAKLVIENTYRGRLFDAIHAHIEAEMQNPQSPLAPVLYRMLAEKAVHDNGGESYFDILIVAEKYAPQRDDWRATEETWRLEPDVKKFREFIPTMTTQQHFMLMVDMIFASEISITNKWHLDHKPETMLAFAQEAGIDAGAIRKQVEAEAKAAQKEAAAAKKATEKDTGKPAAKKAKKGEKSLAALTDGEAV